MNNIKTDSIKNAKHIISSIFASPSYTKLGKIFRTNSSLERLKATLPIAMQEHILNISYHPNKSKLLFCFSHPSFASEFNRYKAKDIISCIKRYSADFSEISLENLQVQGYVSNDILQHIQDCKLKKQDIVECYKEHSQGEFINHLQDKDLHQKVEQIRRLIMDLQPR